MTLRFSRRTTDSGKPAAFILSSIQSICHFCSYVHSLCYTSLIVGWSIIVGLTRRIDDCRLLLSILFSLLLHRRRPAAFWPLYPNSPHWLATSTCVAAGPPLSAPRRRRTTYSGGGLRRRPSSSSSQR